MGRPVFACKLCVKKYTSIYALYEHAWVDHGVLLMMTHLENFENLPQKIMWSCCYGDRTEATYGTDAENKTGNASSPDFIPLSDTDESRTDAERKTGNASSPDFIPLSDTQESEGSQQPDASIAPEQLHSCKNQFGSAEETPYTLWYQ